MKKFLALAIIFLLLPYCNAQEKTNNKTDLQQEIHLDSSSENKTYNLKENDYHNPKIEPDDGDDMPFNFVTSPLQLLKQYQNDW